MAAAYSAGVYRDPETRRDRWAVACAATRVWYFPARHGRRAAERLADQMNKGA